MAVRTLARSRAQARQAAALHPVVLAASLVGPTLDLLGLVEPGLGLAAFALTAGAVTSAALLLTWVRFPRTSWLFAACLAALASFAMRAVGAEVAPVLSLLAVIALGIGGAFSAAEVSLEAV